MDINCKIKIVTIATSRQGYIKWLEESCIRNGTELIILGLGTEWKGYITKFELMKDFLQNENDDNIVCFVDAYDVIMLKNIEDLKNDFIEYANRNNSKIICSLDPMCETGSELLDNLITELIRIEFSSSKNLDLINSGLYMGYAKELKILINSMIEISKTTGDIDDQKLLNIFYTNNKNIIDIDINKEIFYNVPSSELKDKKNYGYNPYFIHRIANGSLINMLEELNYKITLSEKTVLFLYTIETLSKKIPYHCNSILNNFK